MNTILRLMLVTMLIIVATPSYSAEVVQIFNCQQDDDATDEQIKAVAVEWLKAAKKMKGGDQIEVYLRFPVVGHMGVNDFTFVIKAPSLVEWGVFMNEYEESKLQEIDDKIDELCDCPDSSLWEIEKLE